MELTLEKLESLINHAVMLGKMEMINIFVPATRMINRPQLLKYLRTLGYGETDLKRWEANQVLVPMQNVKNGTRKYYTADVQKVLLQMDVVRL